MLVLTRREGETIVIDAPDDVDVIREELIVDTCHERACSPETKSNSPAWSADQPQYHPP